MAFIIFNENEELNKNFYWGALIILLAVFGHPVLNKFKKKLEPQTRLN
jgi:hypothetical protein